MKKVLLLGALLSTMAFGEEGIASGSIAGSDTNKSKSIEITFSGTVYKQMTITADNKQVNFGKMVVGQNSSAEINLILTGQKSSAATLSAAKSMTGDNDSALVISFDQGETVSFSSSGDATKKMNLVYTPTSSATGEISGTVTVTATYSDI